MKAAFWFVCVAMAAIGGVPASAQTAPPTLRPTSAAGLTPARPSDPAVEAATRDSERRLKRRDDASRRALRSICKGC